MNFIDTHAHIYDKKFVEDMPQLLARMQAAQVSQVVMPNIDSETIESMLFLEEKYPDICVATMGLHPCSVDENFQKELYIIENWLSKRKFAAIGEMGTDLYWDKTFFDEQKEAFKIQANWAKKYQIPIIIHCRESFLPTIEMVEDLQSNPQDADNLLKGVFHCFTGTQETAERVIKAGFMLGIGGVLTYKNSNLCDALKNIDLKHIIFETDSPYLPPVPHRGKRNEPAFVPIIAQKLAEIKNISLDEIAKITTENAKRLFGI